MASTVTRFDGGIGNQPATSPLADLKVPFVGSYYQYFNDFNTYVAADWTVTGTGSAALLAAGENGILNVISSAGGEQSLQLGAPALTFAGNTAKELFFSTRLSMDDVGLGGFLVGLSAADTSPYVSAPTDGIYLKKTAGVANAVTATLRSGSVDIASAVLTPTPTNGQFIEVGFAYTPLDGILRAFAGNASARLATMPFTMPVGGLAPVISSFGAAARTLGVDYLYVAKSR